MTSGWAELLDVEAPEWTDALKRAAHDMYHVPEYVALDARLSGGTASAFWYGEDDRRLLLPLIVRDIPDSDLRDAVSPYGYPAPVSDAEPRRPGSGSAPASDGRDLRAQGIVTGVRRLHRCWPTAGRARKLRHGSSGTARRVDGPDVSVEEMWRQTRSDHRNHINRARRDGTRWSSTTGTGCASGWRSTTTTCAGSARRLLLLLRASTCRRCTTRSATACTCAVAAVRRRGGRRQHVLRARRHRHRVRVVHPAGPQPLRRRAAVRRGAAVVQEPRRHRLPPRRRQGRQQRLAVLVQGRASRRAGTRSTPGGCHRARRVPRAGAGRRPARPGRPVRIFPPYR
jgi:hypothetical protein